MVVVRNGLLPFKGYAAMNIFGAVLLRRGVALTPSLLRHEMVHTAQMRETLYAGFYIMYAAEWLIRLPMRGRAYRNISFEREAYAGMHTPGYLQRRPPFAWVRFIRVGRQGAYPKSTTVMPEPPNCTCSSR